MNSLKVWVNTVLKLEGYSVVASPRSTRCLYGVQGSQLPDAKTSIGTSHTTFNNFFWISYCTMSQRSFGRHEPAFLPPDDSNGVFRQKIDSFMDWFRVQTGTIINPKLELVDLRSRGAGRAVSTSTTLISSASPGANMTED